MTLNCKKVINDYFSIVLALQSKNILSYPLHSCSVVGGSGVAGSCGGKFSDKIGIVQLLSQPLSIPSPSRLVHSFVAPLYNHRFFINKIIVKIKDIVSLL